MGIEALSRGCNGAHFVELDSWVIENCLMKNLENTRLNVNTVIHSQTVEEFLISAKKNPKAAVRY